jgi:helicase MOV-10
LSRHSDKLKILLVAPSNDAADILGTKLTQYFPPTELRRILAFSRSVADLPDKLKPHCSEGLDEEGQKNEIMSARIVVGTVNMAARFSFMGVPKGHFNVLVVDEAGHAIEPEVIAVAATLMDYNTTSKKRSGQLLLAGDPKQLGPVISSNVCEKHGLALSYMERLTLREAYGRCGADGQYPPSLLTKLVRNYRSHPAILKLPNTMFYDNELQVCGDRMKTHNLANWEHLPICHFPVLFHAVHGENTREANSPSWFNPHEAETVVQYVNLLVNQSRPPIGQDEIGIITPYARQVQKIRLALKLRDIFHVKVGSVETFQGQERRVIILSTVRAETELIETHDKKYNLGFVANEKRFNVAVTRAQALLIVIGHPNVLATDKHRWLPLMRHCKENGSWIGQEWNEDEDDEDDIEDDNEVENEVNEETSSVVVEDDDDDNDAGVSHRVAQESVAFINREE